MSNTTEDRIRSIIARSATEIAAVVRAGIAEEIRAGKTHIPAASVSHAAAPKKPGRPPMAKKSKGGRRTSDEVKRDDARILEFIKAHPGVGSIAVGKQVTLPKADITSGLERLRVSKKVKTQGKRSATTYTAA